MAHDAPQAGRHRPHRRARGLASRAAAAVLAALLATACGGSLGAADATDPRDDGDVGLPVLAFRWKRVVHDRTGDHRPQEFAAAAVDPQGERVYIGTQEGMFYALRATDGAVIWKARLGAVSSLPLLDGGRLYVGTDDGALLAVEAVDGRVAWRFVTKGAVLHPPVIVGDLLVFSNDADHVYAVDKESGKWRWQYERETPEEFTMRGHAGVAAQGDRVFAGFADGHLVALTAAGGEVVWVRSLAGESREFVDVDSTPVARGDLIYAASTSGGLYAIDAADGTEHWRFPVVGAGAVAVDDQRVYFAAADEGLHALDRRGHLLWRQGLRGGGDPSPPRLDGDYLSLSLAERGLLVVDRASGRLLQSFDPGSGISSPPTIAGDRLYVLSNGGILYAMSVGRF